MTSVKETITRKLTQAFAPEELAVEDESARHQGHAGYREGGDSHFRVRIVAEAFSGKSRVERHRLVNELLADEFAGGMHALAVSALTPEEWRGGGAGQ